MKKVLKNTPKTKKYLEKLPKLYAVFLWAKWAVVEVPWSRKYTKEGIPLVYTYYDCNGACDEYHLVPITQVSSGGFYNWYSMREFANLAQDKLNKELRHD